MKTSAFYTKIDSSTLKENLEKQFNIGIKLENYSREQLEDIRNKLRTRIFQHEGSAGINDLLTNETYQKDKAVLQLLNTRIKEMLGEDIKKLKDRIVELSESKKAAKDYDGDGKVETPKDEVWGSRAKAAAKAGKPFKEAAKSKCCCASKGEEKCPVHGNIEEAHDVKDTGYSKRYSKRASDDDSGDDRAAKHTNPFDQSAALKAHSKSKTGTVVKGKAQSAKQKDDVEEAAPSAGMTKREKSAVVKKAKAGKDIGKPGKGFEKVEKAAKAGGAKDPKAVAAAAMWKQQAKESVSTFKQNVQMVNEGLRRLLSENEEEKAKAITAAGDIVNDYTSWMQRVGQYQSKSMIELADSIRADFGPQQAETFKTTVAPALAATLEVLMQQREAISNAVAVLAGEETATAPMGAEPAAPAVGPGTPDMEPAGPDQMNPEPDEFAASDAAAGGSETSGREMRESRFARKIAESHSLISKLAR